MTESFSRREFLKKTAILTASLSVLPHARVLGANEDIRVGVIGFKGKGSQHIGMFKKLPGVRVVALCDVDSAIVAQALQKHFPAGETQPKTYTDVRKLLEDKDIDAVCIATPNHWHALMTVWACQAGKDVYVEKPCSHSLYEGRQMIQAARKYNRIVQVGMQARSDESVQAIHNYVKEGHLGEIEYLRGIYYSLREPIGKVSGPQQPPPTVDYTLWQGPVPEAPLMRKNLHYDWHWQWPYGNGELGNNGVHMLDLSTYMLDIKEFPTRAISIGGRFSFDDDSETPNTHITYYDYKPHPIICEIRNLPRWKGETVPDTLDGLRVGIQIKCKDGYYLGYNSGGWTYDNQGKRVKQFPGDGGSSHHQNFIDAIRARNKDLLTSEIENGHRSAGLAHIGNISHLLGEKSKGAEIKKAIEGVPLLEDAFERFNEHLLMNTVDVMKTPRVLGAWVTFDPASEKFTGEKADQANAMQKTPYRPGFEVPEQV